MNTTDLNRSLRERANIIGQRRIQKIQNKVAVILQDAAPDSMVEISGNSVRIRAHRLFDRMMTNEKLRSPQSFLRGISGSLLAAFISEQNSIDGDF